MKVGHKVVAAAGRSASRLTVAGKLPEGYVILCNLDGDEYSFLVRLLGISVECPHCGVTRCGTELAEEYYLAKHAAEPTNGGWRPDAANVITMPRTTPRLRAQKPPPEEPNPEPPQELPPDRPEAPPEPPPEFPPDQTPPHRPVRRPPPVSEMAE